MLWHSSCRQELKLHIVGQCLAILCLAVPVAWAQIELQYQNRGDRHEGIKPKPVSGADFELISVLADYREPMSQLPDRLKFKFYLDEPTDVHVTVRELDYKYYYWMDQIVPAVPWKKGFSNSFEWPTKSVLKALNRNMSPYDLGVLARLQTPMPSRQEHVAPVILYHAKEPRQVDGYLFTLKPNGNVRLECAFYEKDGSEPVSTPQKFPRKIAGRPFTIKWDATGAPEGPYRMVLTGYFLDSNRLVNQTVHFYHRPQVK